jgi:ketosteroid isomerase-like protein
MTTTTQLFTSLKEGVHETRNRHVAAVNAGDAKAATSLFGPAAILLPPGQLALEGTPAIRSWFTHVFANFSIQGFSLQPDAVEQHGDLMIENGSWNGTFQPRDGSPAMPAGGTYLTVYARPPDGSIRIIRDTFNGLPG